MPSIEIKDIQFEDIGVAIVGKGYLKHFFIQKEGEEFVAYLHTNKIPPTSFFKSFKVEESIKACNDKNKKDIEPTIEKWICI